MPRRNKPNPAEGITKYHHFDEEEPKDIPHIMAFGELIEKKFRGNFEEYCKNREHIGKRSYIKKDGTFRGVLDTDRDGKEYVRLPWHYHEELSKWQAYCRIRESKSKRARNENPEGLEQPSVDI